MPKRRKKKTATHASPESVLRIIGGDFRRRKLLYNGDPATRPMKDRTREAVFNLVGPSIKGKHAVDLFAGTGALGLEALSRGAARATFIERNIPATRVIRENVQMLEVEDRATILANDTFHWARTETLSGEADWAVFCSPPYSLYVDQNEEMLALITNIIDAAPSDSLIVVEADERFDMESLPHPELWNVRFYRPAYVGLFRKSHLEDEESDTV